MTVQNVFAGEFDHFSCTHTHTHRTKKSAGSWNVDDHLIETGGSLKSPILSLVQKPCYTPATRTRNILAVQAHPTSAPSHPDGITPLGGLRVLPHHTSVTKSFRYLWTSLGRLRLPLRLPLLCLFFFFLDGSGLTLTCGEPELSA